MRFGSLFAGIGGFDLGLERAGMECAWQVENAKFPRKVLEKHWPDVPKFGDIQDVGKENLEAVDLICGGFPCQPFSVAGKRKGTADDRHLWPEMLRVISELKPAWVIGENVPGIIPIFLDQALSDLEAEGYATEPYVFPACAFDAPHRRDRLFIIAHYADGGRNDGGDNWKRGYISEDQKRDSTQSEQTRQRRQYEFGETSEFLEDTGRKFWQGSKKQKESNRKTPQPSIQSKRPSGTSRLISDAPIDIRRTSRNERPVASDGSRQRPEHFWATEPRVGRVAHGVSNRVERLKGLGNAVVPQVVEWIGRKIMEIAE